jgi:hypothetical protein
MTAHRWPSLHRARVVIPYLAYRSGIAVADSLASSIERQSLCIALRELAARMRAEVCCE